MSPQARPLAVVTGASSGIGYELAKCCARAGYDLAIAANEERIQDAAEELMSFGVEVEAIEADLATLGGVDMLYKALNGRPVEALLANAGHGLGNAFLDQDIDAWRHVIDTNITGTLYLIYKIGNDMRRNGHGRILITGSIAGYMPGPFEAVYNGSKAFLDSFSIALRHELRQAGVTVTCLMPGPTETLFFERAQMMDTEIGHIKKESPAVVAQQGFDAMIRGDAKLIVGWRNKLCVALASMAPDDLVAHWHQKLTEPGSARHADKQRAAR